MPVLRPITDTEFAAWLSQAVPAYADDKVASGAWPPEHALERSRQEHAALLAQGKDTPDHYIRSIVDDAGAAVGAIWFAAEAHGETRVAYVYNVLVWPGHRRRGHATRAFAALEAEARRLGLAGIALHVFAHNGAAQALYAGLGFKPTNFNLYKPLGDDGPGRT
jgi:ribosomal protein S18 acetylase RimI-like enzyme